jgi:hypothetical protein
MQFHSKTVTTLIFLWILLVLLAPIKTPFNYYDEGIAVFNATRVMDGDVPYRDFWAIYPPGQFYALAAIFRIFGTTLFVARIYDTIVRFVIVISVYLIAKKTTTRPLALLVCIVTTLLLASARFYAYAVFPSLALGLLSILSLLEHVNTGQRRWLLLTGMLIGIATLFRLDIGLYTGISAVLTIILFHSFRIVQEAKSPIKALFATSELLVILLGAALLIVLPCYGYLGFRSGFNNLWTQVVIIPTTVFHDVRWKPYPTIIPSIFPFTVGISTFGSVYPELLDWLQFYLPLVIYGIAFSHYGLSFLKKRITFNTQYFGTTALTILGVLLFAPALSRYDYIHVVPSSIIAFLVVIPLVHHVVINIQNLVIKYSFLLLLTIFVFLYFLSPIRILLSSTNNFSPLRCYSHLDRASCIFLGRDQEQAVEYIRTHTLDGESIFVGNRRHDLIFANDIGFYFLSNRPSATKYHELHPGVATTRSVQEVIVYDIESKNVNWIVLVYVHESEEPNASAVSSGVHFLDDFIRSKYVLVAEFGNYGIWKRVTK